MAKNSDRPVFDSQTLQLHPGRTGLQGQTIRLANCEIPQAPATCATLGSSPYWCWGYEEGINEHRVMIGNEAIFTKTCRDLVRRLKAKQKPRPGILGMELVRLGLERSTTAREALEVITRHIEKYGQFGSGVPGLSHAEGSYDNSFIIADPREAWVLEGYAKRWAARKIRGHSCSISNQPSIRIARDIASEDIERYAVGKGWWKKNYGRIDIARAYINDAVPRQVSHIRAMRSRELLEKSHGGIDVNTMKTIARDHYENTFLQGPCFEPSDPDFLSICMHASPAAFTWGNTASSCAAELDPDDYPVFWWTPGPPCNGCYLPFFVHADFLPASVRRAGSRGTRQVNPAAAPKDTYDRRSYWWTFRRLTDLVKGGVDGGTPGLYTKRNRIVRKKFDALERKTSEKLPEILSKVRRCRDEHAAGQLLGYFSETCTQKAFSTAHALIERFEREDRRHAHS